MFRSFYVCSANHRMVATAELGLNMPAGKVQDIYIRAMTEPDLMRALLARIPKTEKKATYFMISPGNFLLIRYSGGIEEDNRLKLEEPRLTTQKKFIGARRCSATSTKEERAYNF